MLIVLPQAPQNGEAHTILVIVEMTESGERIRAVPYADLSTVLIDHTHAKIDPRSAWSPPYILTFRAISELANDLDKHLVVALSYPPSALTEPWRTDMPTRLFEMRDAMNRHLISEFV